MPSQQPSQTGDVFNAAAPDHDPAAALLWDPLGEDYVARVRPAPGDRVLDVCCGAGASALPAGRATGPAGRVDAVDLAAGLVERGRRRAAAEGLDQVRFHVADVTGWSAPEPYDVLLCGYGIFFLPDMDAAARRLAGLLRPGGRFSVATWVNGAMDDFAGLLFRHAAAERPGEMAGEPPARRASHRIGTAESLAAWTASLGLADVRVHRIDLRVPLTRDDAWHLVLGSGFRAMLSGLGDEAAARVRDGFLDALATEGPGHFDAASLVAVGTLPGPAGPPAR